MNRNAGDAVLIFRIEFGSCLDNIRYCHYCDEGVEVVHPEVLSRNLSSACIFSLFQIHPDDSET